jgi:hypothetical protein
MQCVLSASQDACSGLYRQAKRHPANLSDICGQSAPFATGRPRLQPVQGRALTIPLRVKAVVQPKAEGALKIPAAINTLPQQANAV